ncbi:response regulator [Limibacter armeniacum]|uniref:response regulator n=1 Tax=Limibacter armeniacum TaxID=466084 RepID=UPI002FE59F73
MSMIFIVDDDYQSRTNIVSLLQAEGFETKVATNAREALVQILLFKPLMILCNCYLADSSGFDLLQEVRSNQEVAHIPFILMSNDDSDSIERALESGADNLLQKPFNFDEIIESVTPL